MPLVLGKGEQPPLNISGIYQDKPSLTKKNTSRQLQESLDFWGETEAKNHRLGFFFRELEQLDVGDNLLYGQPVLPKTLQRLDLSHNRSLG